VTFGLYLQVLTKIWLVSKFAQLVGDFLIDFLSMGLMYLAILGIFVEVNKLMVQASGFLSLYVFFKYVSRSFFGEGDASQGVWRGFLGAFSRRLYTSSCSTSRFFQLSFRL
jgi:hypothetical protein